MPFPIVAVGASAGGIKAFEQLLSALPSNSGMAFVFILHLDPRRPSSLAEILGRATKMPVKQVEDHMRLEPDRVYVIPPGKNLVYSDGLLQLSPRTQVDGLHHPIDHFMRSLAEEHGHQSIGVVLSGTGSDGTLGVQELKSAGGIVFAQDDSAEQTSMPRSAIASGGVDFVLPPEGIASELARVGRHPFVAPDGGELTEAVPRDEPALVRLIGLLGAEGGLDFTNYKRATLHRRIARRMVLHKVDRLEEYVDFLESHPDEVRALYQDILINVTSFFRNPEAYEALKEHVFPALAHDRSRYDQVRVWTLGCSTGEEAYSVAISYMEFAEASGLRVPMQVFASDVNAAGIEKARAGIYPRGIEQDVSEERLERFFTEVDGSYRVSKPIRDMCVFARHNVLADPPFSRLDLVACRNLLIYLDPVLQQKVIPLLHYALRPEGYLWLGSSEAVTGFRELFEPKDPKHKIYRRKSGVRTSAEVLSQRVERGIPGAGTPVPFGIPAVVADPAKEAERLLLTRYAPPGVVIDSDLRVLQFRGDTSPYLSPPPGRASLDLLNMLREGLLVVVRGAIAQAKRERRPVRMEGVKVHAPNGTRRVNVVAIPLMAGDQGGGMVILFEQTGEGVAAEARQTRSDAKPAKRGAGAAATTEEAATLRQELVATREYLQSIIEQLQTTNDELQAANEEVQSGNEELQSVNEELETSKEEIQSTNEELATVNEELTDRNAALAQSNDDLANLLAGVQMPIVMLDWDLCIRRFTPAAEKTLNLIASDVGRPITDINLSLDLPDLDRRLAGVLRSGELFEREVKDREGRWHWIRIRPYRTSDKRVQGAVLLLVDIDALKRSSQKLRESEGRFEAIADSAPVPMWVHGLEGCGFVNRAYADFVGAPGEALAGYEWTRFLHPEDREAFLAAYHDARARKAPFERLARMRRADGAWRWMKSIGAPRYTEGGDFLGFVGSTVDITELKEAESELREADRIKDEFLGMLGHELRNPLAAISNAAYLLATGGDGRASALAIIERQTRNMLRIIDDLLDVSRITHGKINLRPQNVSVEEVARNALDATEHQRAHAAQQLATSFPSEAVWVYADPARLEQILTNLLGNASKFTPRGGHIWLDVEREDDAAVIRVRDDGPGIDPAVLPRIFELFVQGARTDDRARMGVGIGLALARRLVDMHGGTIEARNLPPGKGSEIVVRLPTSASTQPAAPRIAPAQASRGPQRVLVVDDDHDAAEALEQVISHGGHEVRVVHRGTEALDVVREFKPKVVLLDIGLPDIDGYELVRRLREDPQTKDARIVALTGYARRKDVERALKAGFDSHLAKPASPEVLLELIAPAG